MTKTEFLEALRRELDFMTPDDRDAAILYYEEYIDESDPPDEQEVIGKLGPVEKLARELKAEYASDGGGSRNRWSGESLARPDYFAGESSGGGARGNGGDNPGGGARFYGQTGGAGQADSSGYRPYSGDPGYRPYGSRRAGDDIFAPFSAGFSAFKQGAQKSWSNIKSEASTYKDRYAKSAGEFTGGERRHGDDGASDSRGADSQDGARDNGPNGRWKNYYYWENGGGASERASYGGGTESYRPYGSRGGETSYGASGGNRGGAPYGASGNSRGIGAAIAITVLCVIFGFPIVITLFSLIIALFAVTLGVGAALISSGVYCIAIGVMSIGSPADALVLAGCGFVLLSLGIPALIGGLHLDVKLIKAAARGIKALFTKLTRKEAKA